MAIFVKLLAYNSIKQKINKMKTQKEIDEQVKEKLHNMMTTQRSLERLERLIAVDAPTIILQNEIQLLRKRMLRSGLILFNLPEL